MDKLLSDQLDKKANGADEVELNSKKYKRTGPKSAVSNPGSWREVKESMDLLKELNALNEVEIEEAIGTGEAAALAHYEDQTSELKEKLKTLESRLKDHERAAIRKPNLRASGQIINVNKHLDNAIKALSTI